MSDDKAAELARLREEVEKLRDICDECKHLVGIRPIEIQNAITYRVDKIVRLEAEADPWLDAKRIWDLVKGYGCGLTPRQTERVSEYVDHLTAENAEMKHKYDLANATIETATNRLNEVKAENARLTARVAELEDVKDVADMQPPFDGPIVGFEPVLDPARVLATAFEIIGGKTNFLAQPYPLKGGENGD